jgi:hypothetical protein
MRLFAHVGAVLAFVAGFEQPAAAGGLPLDPGAWDIRYSPSMPAHPAADRNGWSFDFPDCGGRSACSVNYVTTRVDMAASQSIKATFAVTINGPVQFHYKLERDNTCDSPARVRLFIQRKGDDLTGAKEFWRWWSNPVSLQLGSGAGELTAALAPSEWLSVFGKRGDASAAAREGFQLALREIGNVGFTFGGGCFYGHGVNITGGTARFTLTGFSVD